MKVKTKRRVRKKLQNLYVYVHKLGVILMFLLYTTYDGTSFFFADGGEVHDRDLESCGNGHEQCGVPLGQRGGESSERGEAQRTPPRTSRGRWETSPPHPTPPLPALSASNAFPVGENPTCLLLRLLNHDYGGVYEPFSGFEALRFASSRCSRPLQHTSQLPQTRVQQQPSLAAASFLLSKPHELLVNIT